MNKIYKFVLIAGTFLPTTSMAAGKDLEWVINEIVVKYFNYAIRLIIAFAIVMFVWNVYRYFISGSDDIGSKKEAGKYVLWSVIGFFVIISIWGLVNILVNSFRLDNNTPNGFFPSFKSSGTGGSYNPNNPYNGPSNGTTPNTGGSNGTTPNTGGSNGTTN